MNGTEEPVRLLRARGLRVTGPRTSVLAFLAKTGRHPTAEEVEVGVNALAPVLSRASVYNVLRTLCQAGLAREVVGPDAAVRYDANLTHHHHFACRCCGRLEDVPWDSVTVSARQERAEGRLVESLTVRLEGLCALCAPSERGEASFPGSDLHLEVST